MKAAVVIPIYKPRRADLTWYEKISLERCIKILGHHPIIFVAPDDRDFDYLPTEIDYSIETFNQNYFADRNGYNVLMINPKFYKRFRAYDYILICQLDAFVFSDRLEEFCRLGYDYIGAPWPLGIGRRYKQFLNVGNGGFSLRRVKACINVLSRKKKMISSMRSTEDLVFSYLGKILPNEFKVAPLRIASRFSFEELPERYYRKNKGVLPFGCHAWHKNSRQFYIQVFAESGCDLTPYEQLMNDFDLFGQDAMLNSFLKHRLTLRLKQNGSILRYLPTGEEFFVLLVDRQSISLMEHLRAEGLKIINEDRIVIALDDKILQAVSNFSVRINRRGLLLSMEDDTSTMTKLLGMEIKYGERFISFWQEYKRQSTELLRQVSSAEEF